MEEVTHEIYKKYLKRLLAMVLILLSFIGGFNFLVDPYGFFRNVEINGFNQQKEGVRNKIRFVKALELPLRKPKTIIIGSSRVHDGINPESLALQDTPAYNLGINMLRMKEALFYLKHAINNSDIKEVVFGLDLFMFNELEKTNPSFDDKLVGKKIDRFDYIPALFSFDATADSIRTIKISYSQPERKEFYGNGYRPAKNVFYKLRNYEKLHYYTNWTFLAPNPKDTPYYADFKMGEECFEDFEEFLQICKENNIKCVLYFSPAHANLDGEGVSVAGLWGDLESLKKRVTFISNMYGFEVWDFSGYNSITTEKVQTPMKYYWDSSHFDECVGEYILNKIHNRNENSIPDDFGIDLSNANIDNALRLNRSKKIEYEKSHPADVELIEGIFKEAALSRTIKLDVSDMFEK
nr:hypothetical protein [uncultured Anaeromusa sp.]